MIALAQLNEQPPEKFTASLSGIFEHSPWVAARAAAARPFRSRLALQDAMRAVVEAAPIENQIALIRAHPKLGIAGRARAQLTEASAREQLRAGLAGCTAEEAARLEQLNSAYVERFAMPFILAVRGHDPKSIIASCERRLGEEPVRERRTALEQIGLIAGYRLADLVAAPAGAEILAMAERLAEAAGGGDAGAARCEALLREWMQAAGLEVCAAGAVLIGRRRAERADATRLILGAHYEAGANAVRQDGRLGFLLAIAVAQHLRQQAMRVPFELAILARPAETRLGDDEVAADPDSLRGCVALATPGRHEGMGDAGELELALLAAGLEGKSLVIARQGPTSLRYRFEQPPDARRLDRAAATLENFLLQNRQTGNDNGCYRS